MNQIPDTPIVSQLVSSMFNGFTIDDLKEMSDQNPYLRGYLQGYFSERMLFRELSSIPGISSISKIPDSSSKNGDFLIEYSGKEITVECKSISTGSVEFIGDNSWKGTVQVKNPKARYVYLPDARQIHTCNLLKGEFDILAICCFAVNGEWKFLYMNNSDLPESKKNPGLIRSEFRVSISDPLIHTHITPLLQQRSS